MSKKKKKGSKAVKLPLPTLAAKARLALGSPALVEIVSHTPSPNVAYELGYLETGDVKKSIACQNLAKIKRDYGNRAFDEIVSSVVSSKSAHIQSEPGKEPKGEDHEEN